MEATRRELQKALAGAEYPAGAEELIAHAEENGAGEEVLADLGELSDDEYESTAAVLADLDGDGDEDGEGEEDLG